MSIIINAKLVWWSLRDRALQTFSYPPAITHRPLTTYMCFMCHCHCNLHLSLTEVKSSREISAMLLQNFLFMMSAFKWIESEEQFL